MPVFLRKNLAVLAGLAGVFVLFALIGPAGFRSADNLVNIVRQTILVAIAALGMTMVIASGGIDLSAGSTVAWASVVTAWLMSLGGAVSAAAVGGVLAASAVGALNGFLITRLHVVPFIVTLGTLLVFRGAAQGLARQQRITAPASWLEDLMSVLPPDRAWQLLPPGGWIMIALMPLVGGLLLYTRFGRHLFAVGSNEQAARLCGVPVERIKVLVYTAGAALAGLAGVMLLSYQSSVGDPTAAAGMELDVIAAVVIGGGSLSGGTGSVFGSVVGALIMTTIRSGCTQVGLDAWVQHVVTGAIIVAAVTLDRLRHTRAA